MPNKFGLVWLPMVMTSSKSVKNWTKIGEKTSFLNKKDLLQALFWIFWKRKENDFVDVTSKFYEQQILGPS